MSELLAAPDLTNAKEMRDYMRHYKQPVRTACGEPPHPVVRHSAIDEPLSFPREGFSPLHWRTGKGAAQACSVVLVSKSENPLSTTHQFLMCRCEMTPPCPGCSLVMAWCDVQWHMPAYGVK